MAEKIYRANVSTLTDNQVVYLAPRMLKFFN